MKNNCFKLSNFQLLDLCLIEIKTLANNGLVNCINGRNKIVSKLEGEIMTKYSISFITMKLYMQVCPHNHK